LTIENPIQRHCIFPKHSYFFQSSVLTPRTLLVASPAVCPVPIIPNSVQSKANAFQLQLFSHEHPRCQLVGIKLQWVVGRSIYSSPFTFSYPCVTFTTGRFLQLRHDFAGLRVLASLQVGLHRHGLATFNKKISSTCIQTGVTKNGAWESWTAEDANKQKLKRCRKAALRKHSA
jgi:hypothetical protein